MYGYNESATDGLSTIYNESATGGLSATVTVVVPPPPAPPPATPQHSTPPARLFMRMKRPPAAEEEEQRQKPVLIPWGLKIRCIVQVARRGLKRVLHPVVSAGERWALRPRVMIPAGLKHEAVPLAVCIPGVGMVYERPFTMRWQRRVQVRGRIEHDVRQTVYVSLKSLEYGVYEKMLFAVTDRQQDD